MRIGYLMIRKSPDTAKDLWDEVGLERDAVMKHNRNNSNQWKDITDNYQAKCAINHRNIYKDMMTDKRSWFKKLVERWI